MASTRVGQDREGGQAPVPGARRLASEAPAWLRTVARVGLAAKGLVYVVVGMLAARAALGDGGAQPGDSRDAFGTILAQPFGRALLGISAAGLLAYALWRLLSAATDADGDGDGWKAVLHRLGLAGSGVVHGLLGWQAARLALAGGRAAGGGDGGGGQAESWTRRLLELPFGAWLVGLAALAIVAYAVYQAYVAFSDKLRKDLDLHELSPTAARTAVVVGRVGTLARSVVFGVIAWLLFRAARTAQAEEAGALQEGLREIQTDLGGPLLLAVVAAGLVAYGLYQFVRARYRRMRI